MYIHLGNEKRRTPVYFATSFWRWYAIGIVFLIFTTSLTLKAPRLSKEIVEAISVNQITSDTASLALMIILLGSLQIFIRGLSRIFIFFPGRGIEAKIKNHYFSKIIRLPLNFFQTQNLGQLLSKLSNDIGNIRIFYAVGVLQILNLIFLSTFAIYQMYHTNALLTIASLVPLSLLLFVTKYGLPYIQKFSMAQQTSLGELNNQITEALVHVHTIKESYAESSFIQMIDKKITNCYKVNLKLNWIRTIVFPLAGLLTGISYLSTLFVGGYEILHQHLKVSDLIVFNMYIGLLSFPLAMLGFILSIYEQSKAATFRLNDLQDRPCEVPETQAPPGLVHVAKAPILETKNLTFSFPSNPNRMVLHNLNFSIQKGESIAISGPIGSGKTTLLHLLFGFYPVAQKGMLFWHGKDYHNVELTELRSNMGYALQNSYFYSNSVMDNLLFGLEKTPPLEEIHAACKKALILDEILDLQDKFDTPIGEKGIRLSGGQKQRLALARLFLRSSELILLDDIFSAVDQDTQRKLLDNFFSMNTTTIVCTHHPEVVSRCDRVIQLEV